MERMPTSEMSRAEADKLYMSLISDETAFKEELALGDETLEKINDTTKEQHLYFVQAILENLDEFSGRGLSIFQEKPRLRIPDLDLDNSDSLRAWIKKLKAARKVYGAR